METIKSNSKKVIGKKCVFEKEIVIPKNTFVDISKFFTNGIYNYNEEIFVKKVVHHRDFKTLLSFLTNKGKDVLVDISNETINEFSNDESLHNSVIMFDLQEKFFEINIDSEKVEMRKRLAIMAYQIQNGLLKNVTVIGWVNSLFTPKQYVVVNIVDGILYCSSFCSTDRGWNAHNIFLTRNSI